MPSSNVIPARHSSRTLIITVVTAIVLLGMVMRSPIIGFGSVAPLVQVDLQLSTQMLGIIGTIPMLAFGVSSFIAPKISQKIGLENALTFAALLLTVGIFTRVWLPNLVCLVTGTVVLSLAISLGNVLVPAVIKKYTPEKIGFVMGLYSLTLSVFAGISAGVAIPLANFKNWQFALGVWGGLAVLALLAWLGVLWLHHDWGLKPASYQHLRVLTPNNPAHSPQITTNPNPILIPQKSVWKMPMAWWISGFMGLQSLLYYTLASFLPSLLIDKGLSPQQAGTMGMIFQFMAFPSIILLSRWVSAGWHLRWLGMAAALANLLGVVGFGFLSSQFAWLWSLCTGFGCGVIFTLCLMLFTLKARDTVQAAQLSGMAQSVGYGIAVFGPLLTGWLKDSTHGWHIPMLFLLGLMLLKCVCAWFATADKTFE